MSHTPREKRASADAMMKTTKLRLNIFVANDHKLNVAHRKMKMERTEILKLWIMMHSLRNILVWF